MLKNIKEKQPKKGRVRGLALWNIKSIPKVTTVFWKGVDTHTEENWVFKNITFGNLCDKSAFNWVWKGYSFNDWCFPIF